MTRCAFEGGRWRLETKSGRRDEADVVIAATGVLHHPNLPEIAGLAAFEGALFHSARWDHGVPLDGRRVGVIGTGSTAVQIVSALVDRVAKLSLFQRTAQWIMPQDNPAYSDEEKAGFRRQPEQMRQLHRDLSHLFAQGFSNAVVDAASPQMKLIEDACRANLESSVADPVLREKLRPSYRAACKRLIISPDFYQAIQKPNAELVTDGDRARRGARRAHARRTAARARRAGAGHRLPRRPLRAADASARASAAGRSTSAGRSGPTPTCRSRCPASRTSSC